MMIRNNGILFLIFIIFLMGIYFITSSNSIEAFTTDDCADMLIQKDSKYYLYNSKEPKISGANPIEFESLEEYVEYTKWQRSKGIRCPVLYLQTTFDAQGNEVYQARPDPEDPQGGLPSTISYESKKLDNNNIVTDMLIDASRDDPPYNQNSYPGFDPQNQTIGENTPLDKLYYIQVKPGHKSTNAMDTNWGGVKYSQDLVRKFRPPPSKGFKPFYIYKENEI